MTGLDNRLKRGSALLRSGKLIGGLYPKILPGKGVVMQQAASKSDDIKKN